MRERREFTWMSWLMTRWIFPLGFPAFHSAKALRLLEERGQSQEAHPKESIELEIKK
jgi:hypothetical protein